MKLVLYCNQTCIPVGIFTPQHTSELGLFQQFDFLKFIFPFVSCSNCRYHIRQIQDQYIPRLWHPNSWLSKLSFYQPFKDETKYPEIKNQNFLTQNLFLAYLHTPTSFLQYYKWHFNTKSKDSKCLSEPGEVTWSLAPPTDLGIKVPGLPQRERPR